MYGAVSVKTRPSASAKRTAGALQVGESAGVHDRRGRLRVAPKARAPLDDRERQYRIEHPLSAAPHIR